MLRALQVWDFLAARGPDIEMFGMFGPGNLGDEAMLVAARRALPGRVIGVCHATGRPWLDRLIRLRTRPRLLVGGGTLIHGGDTGWLDYVEMRVDRGARLHVLGAGIAFTDEQIRERSPEFARWSRLLGQAETVLVRGARSVEIAREMGVEADVFGDFAFLLRQFLAPGDPDARGDVIGLNFGECLGDQAAFEQSAAALVERLAARHSLEFHLVVASDLAPTERIIAKAGLSRDDVTIHRNFFDPFTFMSQVRTYRLFLGLKLHAAGLAMVAGTPSLMIPYLPKCFDFVAPVAAENALVSFPLDVAEVEEKLSDALASPEDFVFSDKIAAIARRQRDRMLELFAQERRGAA